MYISTLTILYFSENDKSNNFKLKFLKKRQGDISISFASVEKANKTLNWRSRYNIKHMCKDAWDAIK